MIEMRLAGVSTRRIEGVSEIFWGSSVSVATVSNLNERAFASVEGWRNLPARSRLPLRLRRRDIPEAQLGRTSGASPSWWPSAPTTTATARSSAPPRASHGVVGELAGLPAPAAVPRPSRRADGRRRQGVRHGRLNRGGVPGDRSPALHRALLPQRPRPRAEARARGLRGHAQGVPRHGVARRRRGQGPCGRGRARVDAARGGRQGRKGWMRGDPGVHGLPERALAPHPHQQRHRATEPRDSQADPRGRHLPGREVGPHARHREAQVRRGERVGIEALPGRDAA